MPDWGQGTWFYRYISPPLREVLDSGPEVDKLLRRPRLISACVMFTDIRGFTALSRSIDPTRLVDTLNLHMAQQARALEQFGGYIENFKGDGLMAVFEGEAMEARACQCALDILDGARQPPGNGSPVPLGIGLHAGEVVRASIGGESWRVYGSFGSMVNTAARLCDYARGPAILASGTVKAAATPDAGLTFQPFVGPRPSDVDASLEIFELDRAQWADARTGSAG